MIESLKKFFKLLMCSIYPALITLFIDAYIISSHIHESIDNKDWAWRWVEPLRKYLFYMAIVGLAGYVVILLVEIIVRTIKKVKQKPE